MWKCVHCSVEFGFATTSEKANHSRWCKENPKRKDYVAALLERNNIELMAVARKKSGITNQYTKAKQEGREAPSNPRKGKTGFKGTPHTNETKEILRQKALASKHRRVLRSTRKYTTRDGSVVLLDSSWEEALAVRLDSLGIKWTRPSSIEWVDDDGKTHNYFPDFYLTEYDVYLDPKNDQVYKMTLHKIEKITKLLPNLLILRSLEECKSFSI